mgnify:FL=1
MKELVKTPPDLGEQLQRKSVGIVGNCDIEILNDADFKRADDLISDAAGVAKKMSEYWSPLKDSAYQNWQLICRREKDMLLPVRDGISKIEKTMKAYRLERVALDLEQQEISHQAEMTEFEMQTAEMLEQGVPQEVIEKIKAEHIPFLAKQTTELISRTKFKGGYEVTIETVKDGAGNEIEQWDKVDKKLLLPQTKAHKEAILQLARDEAKKNYGKKMDGFKIQLIETAKIRSTK